MKVDLDRREKAIPSNISVEQKAVDLVVYVQDTADTGYHSGLPRGIFSSKDIIHQVRRH